VVVGEGASGVLVESSLGVTEGCGLGVAGGAEGEEVVEVEEEIGTPWASGTQAALKQSRAKRNLQAIRRMRSILP